MLEVFLTSSTGAIAESGGVATVTANLTGGTSTQPVTVLVSFAGNAGTGDYSASTGLITIPAGNTTGEITVT